MKYLLTDSCFGGSVWGLDRERLVDRVPCLLEPPRGNRREAASQGVLESWGELSKESFESRAGLTDVTDGKNTGFAVGGTKFRFRFCLPEQVALHGVTPRDHMSPAL